MIWLTEKYLLTNDLNKEITEVQKIKRQLEALGKKETTKRYH